MKKLIYVLLLNLSLATFFINLCLADVSANSDSISTDSNNFMPSTSKSIVEENKLNIPVGAKSVSKITKEMFNNIINEIQRIYNPIISSKNAHLIIEKDWANGTVNAYANRSGRNWLIHIYGGIARHPAITADGLAIVVCHELGHHIAGIPKVEAYSWASNEGQSDYYSVLKCFRKYVANDNNEAFVKKLTVPDYVSTLCSRSFANLEDIAICKRTSMAGKSVSDLFASLRYSNKTNFNTPDPKIMGATYNAHPAPQCRLDTYFAGALCPVSDNEDVSDFDVTKGTCTKKNGYTKGLRPRCWYKPTIE
ncbi:MAG: hypothetical protein HQK51_08320 [Oligoflexia bacterium]|nr:hypothetical protein [Oligoflexia bacterium]